MSQATAPAPAPKPAPKPKAYEMPVAEVGMAVLWFQGGDLSGKGEPAIISRAGPWSICLNIIDPGSYNFRIRDGVRHASDPQVERRGPDVVENGCWDYTPFTKKLLDLVSE